MLEFEAHHEQMAVEARFRALVAEWDISRRQAAILLGVEEADLGLDLVPRRCTSTAERRLRLLVEIRSLLAVLVPDAGAMPLVVRDDGCDAPLSADGRPIGSILEFLMGPESHLSALLGALRSGACR